MDADLYENLRSFCRQDHPEFQIIFGVRAVDDPAIPIIKQIMREFPGRDLSLIIDDHLIGTNFKVCNLANMLVAAKHEILVIADSDMRVDPDYLAAVTAPFADPRVGAATCLYKGTALDGWPSRLASMFINEWFLRGEPQRFPCLGGYKYFYLDWNFLLWRCHYWEEPLCSVFDFNDSYRIRDDCTRCMIDCYRDASVMQHVAIALSDSVAMLQQGCWRAAAQGLFKRSVFASIRSVLENRPWITHI